MSHSEQLLHYIWKFRLFSPDSLRSVDGTRIEVIDPGMENEHAGPDFFNAKIKIDNTVWAGNVEIHHSTDDWVKHGHHLDKAYNSVILHVSEELHGEVKNERGELLPQCRLEVPDKLRKSADYLIFSKCNVPCKNFLSSLSKPMLNAWFAVLTTERLERKTNDINAHLERFNNSWDEVFYVMLTRNFGFGINSDAFERLARSLPYKCILKHSDNLFQVEALLFGQAGLLEDDKSSEVKCEDPDHSGAHRLSDDEGNDDYFSRMQREYAFLKAKYALKSIDGYLLKKLRVRPRSFPEVRIAQLAALLQKSGRLFSNILEKEDYAQLLTHFRTEPSGYWRTHYSFGKESGESRKTLGAASLDIIIINTVVPILFAYGKKTAMEEYCNRAVRILKSIRPERNAIVREFREGGITPINAADTQALIQLRNEYCDKRKCLYCRIGYRLLSSDQQVE